MNGDCGDEMVDNSVGHRGSWPGAGCPLSPVPVRPAAHLVFFSGSGQRTNRPNCGGPIKRPEVMCPQKKKSRALTPRKKGLVLPLHNIERSLFDGARVI
jgi:hypothetical protein